MGVLPSSSSRQTLTVQAFLRPHPLKPLTRHWQNKTNGVFGRAGPAGDAGGSAQVQYLDESLTVRPPWADPAPHPSTSPLGVRSPSTSQFLSSSEQSQSFTPPPLDLRPARRLLQTGVASRHEGDPGPSLSAASATPPRPRRGVGVARSPTRVRSGGSKVATSSTLRGKVRRPRRNSHSVPVAHYYPFFTR